jgi:hypothetical protein
MSNLNLSIHGNFKDGKYAGQRYVLKYNGSPQISEPSNSPRAKRRRARKSGKK